MIGHSAAAEFSSKKRKPGERVSLKEKMPKNTLKQINRASLLRNGDA